jgi:hypothetical protein
LFWAIEGREASTPQAPRVASLSRVGIVADTFDDCSRKIGVPTVNYFLAQRKPRA